MGGGAPSSRGSAATAAACLWLLYRQGGREALLLGIAAALVLALFCFRYRPPGVGVGRDRADRREPEEQRHGHALDPGRDRHSKRPLSLGPTFAGARLARVLDHATRATAHVTSSGHGKEALLITNLTTARTSRTGLRLTSRCCARTFARVARLQTWKTF